MDREAKNLGHGKQSKVKSVFKPPGRNDGSDGDMQVFNGTLYVKNKNIWYSYSGSPIGSGLGPRSVAVFSAQMNGNQTLTDTLLIVEFDETLIDTVRGFSESTYKYSVQAGYEGYYFVGGDVTVQSSVNISVTIRIEQNRADGSPAELWDGWMDPHDDTYNSINKSAIFLASAGDTFQFKAKVASSTEDIIYADKSNFYGFKIG